MRKKQISLKSEGKSGLLRGKGFVKRMGKVDNFRGGKKWIKKRFVGDSSKS